MTTKNTPRHLLIEKSFSSSAKKLRSIFHENFKNPLITSNQRFVWDYWQVKNQYTLLRTPAYNYFPSKLYMNFHKELVMWGRRNLGCWDISPPWLSCYINGCKQELHSDVPHGPWAFVFSLTPNSRKFSGGETLIAKPELLSYWSHFSNTQERERSSFVDLIPAHFNQLVVFDPRYPHGVTEVRGAEDPLFGRLVIHGWFTEPKTYIEGPLPKVSTEKILNQAFDRVSELVQKSEPLQGTLSLQLQISKLGQVQRLNWGTKNLLTNFGQEPRPLLSQIEKIYKNLQFSKAQQKSQMTIPLIIQ